ncbi:hypothetical protein PTKIN_Ptkin19aG0010800 [Pterospermum kingtungense]
MSLGSSFQKMKIKPFSLLSHLHISSLSTPSVLILLLIFYFLDLHDTIIKAMNILSSFLIILLLSLQFHHSSLALTVIEEDFGIDKARDLSVDLDDQDSSFHADDDRYSFQRKELHEVHSGPNPISNSVPQQRFQTILRRRILP